LKDVPYEELAAAFNLPLGTVKTHLHRARRELRKLLENELA
jgi:DNA-directed RNA polymerase specialized sigma24 family protein